MKKFHRFQKLKIAIAAVLAASGIMVFVSPAAQAATQESFYSYTGSTPLAALPPGTVLKTRELPYHIVGLPIPIKTVQLLYRSTDQSGQAVVNVTSVVRPIVQIGKAKAVSYQSAYDSLNPADEPSRVIAGGLTLGGVVANVETVIFAPLLVAGYTIVIPDTEGQQTHFAVGPEYGVHTLNSLRAATRSTATGLNADTKVGLLGYSGGAIATGWASQLAPSYAPEINKNLVGAAEGGVFVAPAHNLEYVGGTTMWAGVAGMALAGISKGFQIDLGPYLSEYGKQTLPKLQNASILNALFQYPGLSWQKLVKPEFADFTKVPAIAQALNTLNMGSAPSPTIPLFIGQAANGELETTPGNKPGIGRGDGVMIAGDVRSLARQFCAAGTAVQYKQYDLLSHFTGVAAWAPAALGWLTQRFTGQVAPNNCASIAPGNPLTPVTVTP